MITIVMIMSSYFNWIELDLHNDVSYVELCSIVMYEVWIRFEYKWILCIQMISL